MFNSSLDAYGAISRPVLAQSALGFQVPVSARVGAKTTDVASTVVPLQVDKPALEAAVKKLNELVAPALQSIQFSLDEEANRVVVKVVDTETQKVLRQIPNEEVLAFSKSLGQLQGLVVRQTA
jgi:flagellar protein FlaG